MILSSITKLLLADLTIQTSVRALATSWNPRYRILRRKKLSKVTIPDYDEIREELRLSSEERRSKQVKEGIAPPVSFEYKPLQLTTSGEIFDAYVPPEGDGKRSIISSEGLSQLKDSFKSSGKHIMHKRKIKQYEEGFNEIAFALEAQKIFIDAHEALCKRDADRLIELVTESCYPKMWYQNKFKTVRWEWIETIEEPIVKHLITRELLSKKSIFAQITVRFHSKQKLAVYDRFGRLAYGDDNLAKNVLEYVVFEKNLTSLYGQWRVHDKIVPEWSEPKMPIINTYEKPKVYKLHDVEKVEESKFNKDDSHLTDVQQQKQ